MELNEQEAHCIARLLQGAWYGETSWDGCSYCKFQCTTKPNGEKSDWYHSTINGAYLNYPMREAVSKRLTDETGVDLDKFMDGQFLHSSFPAKKFLKNANENAKQHYRDRFSWIKDI